MNPSSSQNETQASERLVEAREDLLRVHQVYLEERNLLVEHEHQFDLAYNAALFTLSGGVIGVSLTQADALVTKSSPIGLVLLAVSMGLLMLVATFALLSLKFSQHAYAVSRRLLDQSISANLDSGLEVAKSEQERSFWRRFPNVLDWCLAVMCGVALIMLAIAIGLAYLGDSRVKPSSATSAATTTQTDTSGHPEGTADGARQASEAKPTK